MHQIKSIARNISALLSDKDGYLIPAAEIVLCLSSPRYTTGGRGTKIDTVRFTADAGTLREAARQLNDIAREIDTLDERLTVTNEEQRTKNEERIYDADGTI